MLIYYIIMAILGTVNLIIYITRQGKRSNSNITILFYLCFISNLGYVALATASNVEVALLANKICYLGGCFLLPHVFFATMQLCNYDISTKLKLILYSISMVMYASVLSSGYLPIYYKNVSLANSHGVSYLVKEYGFAHTLFYIALLGYVVSILIFIVYMHIKHRNIPFGHMVLFSIMACSGIMAFILGKLLPAEFETMPIMYIICSWVFLSIKNRVNMYDIEASVSNSINQQQTYGYITFDSNKNYLGSNNLAFEFFPELLNLKIDFPITDNQNTPFLTELSAWLNELTENEVIKSYKNEDKYYRCILKYLYHDNAKSGYIVEIVDNTDREKYVNLLNQYNSELSRSVEEKTAHIRAMHDRILFAMGNMVENRDNNTGGHIYRTSYVVKMLTVAIKKNNIYQMPDYFYDAIIKYAPLHDLGKIAIDDSILRKPDKLTEAEFDTIKTHSEKGAKIVTDILKGVENDNMVTIATNIALYHHEKWNGTGYPHGLAGNDIPLEARIMALADTYDALVSKRSYKEKMSYQQVYEIIKESMGSHFDPNLLEFFEQCRYQIEEYYETQDS